MSSLTGIVKLIFVPGAFYDDEVKAQEEGLNTVCTDIVGTITASTIELYKCAAYGAIGYTVFEYLCK